jgi:hypothetical protein
VPRSKTQWPSIFNTIAPIVAAAQWQHPQDSSKLSEGADHTFESCRVRHFGTKLGFPNRRLCAIDHRAGS